MATVYYAVIADAVASRRLAPARRAALQTGLRAVARDVTRRHRRAVAAAFALTLGDELQGLVADPAAIWPIAHALRAAVPDVDWIVACGRGAVTTPPARTAPEMDGPCFHAARAALESAKRARLVFAFGGFGPALEAFPPYYAALHHGWTARQRRLASLLRAGLSPAQAAAALEVDRSAISHLARRMAWPLVARGDRMFVAAILEAS
jgi:hypothetical protein